jgi:hypothetical protein
MGLWVVSGISAVSNECEGLSGDELEVCQAATAIGGGLGVTFIFGIWFIGFVIFGLIWLMSRPREKVNVYGPEGQKVTVTEKEAARRVASGWTYQRVPASTATAPPSGTDPPSAAGTSGPPAG